MRRTLLAVLVVAACSSGPDDASKDVACRHYASLAQDGLDGVLTDAEFTERSRSIYETAQVSDDSGFRTLGARLSQQTQDADFEGAVATLIDISQECGA